MLVSKVVVNARRSLYEVYVLLCFNQNRSSLQIFGELPNRKFAKIQFFHIKRQTEEHKNTDMKKPVAALPFFEIMHTRLKISGVLF